MPWSLFDLVRRHWLLITSTLDNCHFFARDINDDTRTACGRALTVRNLGFPAGQHDLLRRTLVNRLVAAATTRAALHSTTRLTARAASAPATKLQSPAPDIAAPTATA